MIAKLVDTRCEWVCVVCVFDEGTGNDNRNTSVPPPHRFLMYIYYYHYYNNRHHYRIRIYIYIPTYTHRYINIKSMVRLLKLNPTLESLKCNWK